MPTLSSNLDAMLGLAGYNQSAQLPNALGQGARIINQVARMMMREGRLSDQNQYLKFAVLNSPQKEVSIPQIVDPNSICTVELLTDSVNDSRRDVDLVGRLDLNRKEERGDYAAARFGHPTKMRFSWNPSDLGETIYVGYEVLPVTDTGMTSAPLIPESYHDCLVYRGAAIFKETILNKECTPVFLDTLKTLEKQWTKWCSRSAEERPTVRPGFGSLDFGDPFEGGWY